MAHEPTPMHIFDNILNLPSATLSQWGYLILLAATLFETAPLFGVFIPGQTLVIISGVLVKMGTLDFIPLLLIVSFGAIAGDTMGYLIGRKYGYKFISKYGKYFLLKKSNFEKVQKLIGDHAGKTLILGRLNSFTRATVPLITGASRVKFRKFFTFNILGGIIWALSFIILGFIFGASYEIASKYVGQFILLAIILTIAIVFTYRFVDKRKHIFEKYHLYSLSLCIVSTWIFFEMLDGISAGNSIAKFDIWVNSQTTAFWNPALNKIVIFVTNLGGSINIAILSAALLIALIAAKKWYYSILLLFSMGGGVMVEKILKMIIERPRPHNSLIAADDFSFPSGHATMSTIFFSLLLYSFKNDIKNPILKKLFIAGNILIFFLIGLSRIYLNVHWVSDVIAGFSLGVFWLTLLIIAFKITISLAKSYKEGLSQPK